MTPEQYLGHRAFRVVESRRWPPTGRPCFASFLQGPDGTVAMYLRGTLMLEGSESAADAVAAEVFPGGCHRCVFEFSYGRLNEDGSYDVRFGTTQRRGKENPWGKLCTTCRHELAVEAAESFVQRLKQLGVAESSSWFVERALGNVTNTRTGE